MLLYMICTISNVLTMPSEANKSVALSAHRHLFQTIQQIFPINKHRKCEFCLQTLSGPGYGIELVYISGLI